MLGKLFGSNARVKILKLFLVHPENMYYIRQISRNLKLQLNSVRRELTNLEKFGLLVSVDDNDCKENKKNDEAIENLLLNFKKEVNSIKSESKDEIAVDRQDKKYYKVNTSFILFEEIKSLIIRAQILYEKDFIKKLQTISKLKLLILSGFFVNNNSVVDMLIVGKINKAKFIKLIKTLEQELGREINYTIMDHKEFKYRKDITDIFLYEILENKKIIVIDELKIFNATSK